MVFYKIDGKCEKEVNFMKMVYYTPAHGVTEGFGGASFGFAGAEDETAENKKICSFDLDGTFLSGTYAEILGNIPEGTYQAGVVLLGNAGNENAFIQKLAEKTKTPLVGGAAAIHPVTGEKGLITGRSEAAVFFINDSRYDVEVISENIHREISKHTVSFTDRWIDAIDGCEPKAWLSEQKEKFGISQHDFEHLTLSDAYGINAHLSEVDGRIFSGRDLTETMYLRVVAHKEVQEKIQRFYDDKNAVVFGCAGLKGILDAGLTCPGTGLFMFGEVCTVNDRSDFGNLMLSKIKFTEKSKLS